MSGKGVVGADITINKAHHSDLGVGGHEFPWELGFWPSRLNFQEL